MLFRTVVFVMLVSMTIARPLTLRADGPDPGPGPLVPPPTSSILVNIQMPSMVADGPDPGPGPLAPPPVSDVAV